MEEPQKNSAMSDGFLNAYRNGSKAGLSKHLVCCIVGTCFPRGWHSSDFCVVPSGKLEML
jgi:hypothetical protein